MEPPPVKAKIFDPTQGGVPLKHDPIVELGVCTKNSVPAVDATKMFLDVASYTGGVKTNAAPTLTGQPDKTAGGLVGVAVKTGAIA
jgi:hypothetical protein